MVERLQQARVPARLVTIELTMLNKLVTSIKGAFSKRAIRISPTETFLLEQLEALKVLETRSLLPAPQGGGCRSSAPSGGL